MLPLAFPFCPVLLAQEDSRASRQQVPSSASGLGLVPPPSWQDVPGSAARPPGLGRFPWLESPSLTCLAGCPQQQACPGSAVPEGVSEREQVGDLGGPSPFLRPAREAGQLGRWTGRRRGLGRGTAAACVCVGGTVLGTQTGEPQGQRGQLRSRANGASFPPGDARAWLGRVQSVCPSLPLWKWGSWCSPLGGVL